MTGKKNLQLETHIAAHNAKKKALAFIDKKGLGVEVWVRSNELVIEGDSEEVGLLGGWLQKQKFRFI